MNRSMFGIFKNSVLRINSLSDVALDAADLFCWYKLNKSFLEVMAAAKVTENRRLGINLIFLMWDIYEFLPELTHKSH